ncbi:unnamed protein product [Pipistrellus nathusii]|uniref:Uncharacterized protein n=1 Tax=Pipistrellus nathusii TaxID=59473 RepID=A0ABP0AH59_PIPNA
MGSFPLAGDRHQSCPHCCGQGWGLQAEQQLPCPISSWPLGFVPRSLPSTPQPKAMTKLLPGQWYCSGLSPAPGVCPPTNGRASKGPVSQRQLFLGSPGPMMLPPIPFVPPLCVPVAEKGTWDQRGGDNGERHFWPWIRMGIPSPIHPVSLCLEPWKIGT